ncbi:competence/damage-inducible protein A [Sandaracinus amylolyticus]|uniref:CinA-like protein n=1 Tax=Sandaracinus amylolyticus TaxID=927083 RepID=A0A0F6YKH7_9BACT|nr:competence/damage-inducible protein A [Sandaracinus amylolyticus]AKF08151.1 Molybdopterin binding motif, CinA [Sandaracinus amylolyticus]
MTAAVLSIGTELTRGELVNTNASWLAERLTLLGFEVQELRVVDDDVGRIVETLRALASKHRVIVATGGLGPTTDDLTTIAAAQALGVGLERHEPSLDAIRRRFAKLGREMSKTNEKQADFPIGATILPNAVGTAPGFAIELDGARVFFLPGVPFEMRRIVEDHVEPAIASLAERTTHQIRLRTFGLPESVVGEKLSGIEESEPAVTLGYRASFPEIEVKVLARASNHAEAEGIARRIAQTVRDRLGDAVFGETDDTFAGYVGQMLRDRGLTLAIAESCTGGMIGAMVTSVPGSSEYLLLDAVTYSNAAKHDLLGVDVELMRHHGAVSGEVAGAMAEGALARADAHLGVAVTGIAGPGGGTDAKPVGTVWFALAQRGAPTVTRTMNLPGDRERIRTLASYVALKMVADAAISRGRA